MLTAALDWFVMDQDAISAAAAAMSKLAHAALTPAQRSAKAKKAALARWRGNKPATKGTRKTDKS